MATETPDSIVPKFPLRLLPSVRRNAEAYSRKEGVSLNQFINVAVAEKLAHLQHEEWLQTRREPTPELAEAALTILKRHSEGLIEAGDELPPGYRSKLLNRD